MHEVAKLGINLYHIKVPIPSRELEGILSLGLSRNQGAFWSNKVSLPECISKIRKPIRADRMLQFFCQLTFKMQMMEIFNDLLSDIMDGSFWFALLQIG